MKVCVCIYVWTVMKSDVMRMTDIYLIFYTAFLPLVSFFLSLSPPLSQTHTHTYTYIYAFKKEKKFGHIRIINLFPSC